jgi:CMP-N,N'-diacetyllegionaminic acid synthase
LNLLVTICARGGSKGIPGKNIQNLNDKPLIAYSIDIAKTFAVKYNADMALSTDSIDIKVMAAQYGLVTEYNRPEFLSGDSAGKIDTIADIKNYSENVNGKKYDYVLDLDITSPLRTLQDLEDAWESLKANPAALNIFSVNPSNRNPYFNMVESSGNGFFGLVKKSHDIKSRQSAPLVYDMNASFYFYRNSFFDEGWKISITDRSLIYIMPHICFDLDHPHDFVIMEIMLKEKLIGFSI